MRPCRAIRWRRKEPVVPDLLQGVFQYTSVYKRGGHAPCSCDVTLKKKCLKCWCRQLQCPRGRNDKGKRQFCKGTYSEPVVIVAEVNSDGDGGSGGPTKFRGLWQLILKTAIVAKVRPTAT
jgi:hypothetical protein